MKIIAVLSVLYIAVCNGLPFADQLAANDVDNSHKWVVLCAGSSGWSNYGDQAIVYRAYHQFRALGIPESNIIVMHYDDIANNARNPTPGKVVNEIDGPDVYKGVPKDYTGEEVTPKNFLGVIQGDEKLAAQGKKVVKSGPNDHVFLYFGDHGSMFHNHLADNINVYATTSSNYNELSYFYTYSPLYKTYISSFFANNWLDDDRTSDLTKETFGQQFQYFASKSELNISGSHYYVHSQQYGDLAVTKLTVSEFLGNKPKVDVNRNYYKSVQNSDAVNKWDVSLDLLQRRVNEEKDINEKNGLMKELEELYAGRQYVDKHMTEYVNSIQHLLTVDSNAILNTKQELNNRQCYRQLVDTYHQNCFNLNQAIVYRAYHLFKAYGIPESNLIVMHYDDIANNSQNPTPGIVVNDIGGPDVYKGVPKDYTGKDVNPQTFLKVLQGDAELAAAGKKVVKSGPNDHVFVYFGDHGSTDLVAFPSSYLYAKDLNAVLVKLNEEKKFAQLTIYLDTCDSGSMFRNHLPANVNVYASTSSDYDELSWFYIYDDKYKTYISSFFADNWLDNEAQSDINTETLQQQYQYLKDHHTVQNPHSNTTHEIHAQQYGDLNVAKTKVAEFLGLKPKNADRFVPHLGSNTDAVNKYDVSIDLLQRRIASAQDINEKNSLIVELEGLYAGRQYVDKHINNYVNSIQHLLIVDNNAILNTKQELNNGECYRKFVDTFHENCFNLGEDTAEKLGALKGIEDFLTKRLYVDNNLKDYLDTINLLVGIDTEAILKGKHPLHHRKCYRKFVNTFNEKCFNLNKNPYALKKMQVFVNICETLRDWNDVNIALNQLISYCHINIDQNMAQKIQ
ncbi:unnamed protein product [Medioppia subpectinata]|uniref:Legumain prodomain domain-containing protein n=1 Tax=Medioppia subpectinata TaxID=1979941 RepID=A0A7R9KJY4_9ACAR|nr:unnamed protein product [Medioppia subpectinata]CAG2104941.1 unnamed protein product [Medioppia subpectinata]